MCRILFIFITVMLWPALAFAQGQATGYLLHEAKGSVVLTLELSSKPAYHVFRLPNPQRLVVDLMNIQRGSGFPLGKELTSPHASRIRSGIQDGVNLRVVLDLNAPLNVTRSTLTPNAGHYTLTVEMAQAGVAAPKITAIAPLPSPVTPPPKPQPAQTNLLPLIVIDPGHGGIDPGTQGYAGTYEKQVTLAYALALKEALDQTRRYRVLLTRSNDSYVPLKERVEKARHAKGDVFISLHADAHANTAMRGLSVYTLSETASDKEAEALAAKENNSDMVYNVNLNTQSPEVKDILIDIIQRETTNASASLAENIVTGFKGDVTLLRAPHRFAGFKVLTAPDIPSLLIELGYMSNPQEEKKLLSPEYKKKLVNAVVQSIDRYFRVVNSD